MEPKKNPEVNLERKRGLFLQIGLVIALLVVLGAFEYKTYEKIAYNLGALNLDDLEEEIIPITKQEIKPPPPPPPPPEVIEIVEDDVVIEDEIEIEDTESDEDEEIEIIEEDDDEFFMVVENMPIFPGGDLGLMKYIQKHVKYPAIAKEYNITGKVYVSFIIDKSGSVTKVKIVRGVDKNLDAEAVRVVKSLPKYKPGKQRGKPVRVMFTIPINFTLN
jgi:protein TonB